ncbi:AraC family transcriptional regulator [uncultured Ruminococcus sp.]|uniref:helix-turn-helix domain-containing protein n=1 Tax=uncultured Ruminococcus sp. TaxID=165186 RepID=UPI002605F73C|nr:AraC family transcriptional regulator [uncultured Ruminococcus sp.]
MTAIQLFPDIRLISGAGSSQAAEGETEISICIGGCCEYRTGDGYYYLTAGSCIIRGSGRGCCNVAYSRDYRGITLLTDRHCGSGFDDVFGIREQLAGICETEMHVFRADEKIQQLAEEIYVIGDDPRKSMLRIKTVELLMLIGDRRNRHSDRADTIKLIGEFICKNVSEHYTIAQLSELFKIDPTTLKLLFRQNYGCPIYTYTKSRKMFRAAELLRDTEMKVIDIAEEVGYCNASKFSGAFRDVMGTAPKNYQMEHKNMIRPKDHDIS